MHNQKSKKSTHGFTLTIKIWNIYIGSLGCWSHLDPIAQRLKGLGVGLQTPTGQFSLKDVVYQDAGTYKCIGHGQSSSNNKKKLEVLHSVGVAIKGKFFYIFANNFFNR